MCRGKNRLNLANQNPETLVVFLLILNYNLVTTTGSKYAAAFGKPPMKVKLAVFYSTSFA